MESIIKGLFLGDILEGRLFPFPKFSKDERETLDLLLPAVNDFMSSQEERFREFDKQGAFADDYLAAIKELGLFGLVIGQDFGGAGLGSAGYARVVEEISRFDASTSITIGAHASIGMKGLLLFGNDEQKKRYLPQLATGEMMAAFCLTEPGSGSDAASISTRAEKQPDGSWRISGAKLWISNGSYADFFTVFAKTDSTGGKISAFIVEKKFGGITIGPKEDKMGIRASATNAVTFENVPVPAANLLGEEGKGFKVAMAILNHGRTGLGGGTVGGMKSAIAAAVAHAKERKQFGKSIAEFGLMQEKIALMVVDCYASEAAVRILSNLIDSGVEDYAAEAAAVKVFTTEALWRVVNDALQIAGGNGFMRDYKFERLVRDSRINLIFEGTNQILRLFLAMAGLKEAGGYLKDLSHTMNDIFNHPLKGFGVLSGYAGKKLAQLTPLGRERLDFLRAELLPLADVYIAYTQQLAAAAEAALKKHGSKIVEEQLLMARFADVATDLYVGLAVLSRANQEGNPEELTIAKIFTNAAKRRMNQALRRLAHNEDAELVALSKGICEADGYKFSLE